MATILPENEHFTMNIKEHPPHYIFTAGKILRAVGYCGNVKHMLQFAHLLRSFDVSFRIEQERSTSAIMHQLSQILAPQWVSRANICRRMKAGFSRTSAVGRQNVGYIY